jgi:NTE family protein
MRLGVATSVQKTGEFLSTTSDFNFILFVSLLAGRKLDRILAASFAEHPSKKCGSSFVWQQLHARREVAHTHGNLKRALLASMAIPGFSADRERQRLAGGRRSIQQHAGRYHGPNRRAHDHGGRLRPNDKQQRELAFDQVPNTWTLLVDRLKPRAQRRYHLPSLINILMAANTLNSDQR